jgi:hypothetical protein
LFLVRACDERASVLRNYFCSPPPDDTDPMTPSGSGVEISKLKFGEDQLLVTVLPDS